MPAIGKAFYTAFLGDCLVRWYGGMYGTVASVWAMNKAGAQDK